MALLLCER